MWKELTKLFENNSDQRKLELKDKLEIIKTQKNEIILKYLSKVTKFCDEQGGVSVIFPEDDLVSVALLCLRKSWHSY